MIAEGEARLDDEDGPPSSLASADWSGAPEVDTQTLFERRSTTTTILKSTLEDPAGPASPDVVAGHSGADHPLGYSKAEPSVSFGEVPFHPPTEPCRPRVSDMGCSGVLPTPSVLIAGTHERLGRLEDVSGIMSPREHGQQKAGGTVKHKVHSVCKGSVD